MSTFGKTKNTGLIELVAVHRDQLRAQRLVTNMGEIYLYLYLLPQLEVCIAYLLKRQLCRSVA